MKVLVAELNKTYTNGLTYGKVIHLGIHDLEKNWHLIDDAEVPHELTQEIIDLIPDDISDDELIEKIMEVLYNG